MKIALQLYTLRDFMKTDEQIKETLKKVKEMGYDAVQVSGIGAVTKEKAELIQMVCKQNNLTICATHVGLNNLLNEFDFVVDYHKLWDCQYVGVGMMPAEYSSSEEKLIEFAHIMNELGEKLYKEGIILLYHNHAFEYRKFNGQLGMDILKAHFNPYVQFEIDTFWVQKGGSSPVSWINHVNGKMDVVHFKDMGLRNWDEQMMEIVGNGNLEWDEIIKACLDNRVLWACVEQDDCQGRDPFSCVKTSLEFLKNKGLN